MDQLVNHYLCSLSQVLPAVAKLILVHFHWQVTQILDRYVLADELPPLPPLLILYFLSVSDLSCAKFVLSIH